MKFLLLTLLTLFALAGIALCVWITTPLYAFQEAAAAAKNHDLKRFHARVDVRGFVESLLDDLLVQPCNTTPQLTPLQREVAHDAVWRGKISHRSRFD